MMEQLWSQGALGNVSFREYFAGLVIKFQWRKMGPILHIRD